MPVYITFDANGLVSAVGTTSGPVPPEAYEVPPVLSPPALASMMLVARPTLDDLVVVGGTITPPPLPVGTRVEVHDISGEERLLNMVVETDGWCEEIVLPDPGTYAIDIVPPLPFMPVSRKITVDAE